MSTPRQQGLRLAEGIGVIVFLLVLGLSLYFMDTLSWESVAWSFFKAAMGIIVGFLFILLVSDTLIKGLRTSVRDEQKERKEGGFLYHFIPPSENEVDPALIKGGYKKIKSKKDKASK